MIYKKLMLNPWNTKLVQTKDKASFPRIRSEWCLTHWSVVCCILVLLFDDFSRKDWVIYSNQEEAFYHFEKNLGLWLKSKQKNVSYVLEQKIEYLGMALGTSVMSTVFIGRIVLQVLLNRKEWLSAWIVSLWIMLEACDCRCFRKIFYAEVVNIAC